MSNKIEHILKAIEDKKTSLGDNPALPPDDDSKYLHNIVVKYYNNLGDTDIPENEIGRSLTECIKEESRCKIMLEELAATYLQRLFNTETFDGVELELNLVDNIDMSNERMYPETTDDFSFEDIDDMKNLSGEVYKRRVLNMLISGAAHYYGDCIEKLLPEIGKVNSNLPPLYKKIINSNDKYIYESTSQGLTEEEGSVGGKVDIYVNSGDAGIKIIAEGIILPVLLIEAVKGLLELSIAHGLPENRDKAMYIISKADFKFAELWDQRIGMPIWSHIMDIAKNNNVNIDDKILYFFMEVAQLPTSDFNNFVANLLASTKRGIKQLEEICKDIENKLEKCEFDQRIGDLETNNPIPDNGYYDSENADKLLISDAVI